MIRLLAAAQGMSALAAVSIWRRLASEPARALHPRLVIKRKPDPSCTGSPAIDDPQKQFLGPFEPRRELERRNRVTPCLRRVAGGKVDLGQIGMRRHHVRRSQGEGGLELTQRSGQVLLIEREAPELGVTCRIEWIEGHDALRGQPQAGDIRCLARELAQSTGGCQAGMAFR
jgi:hypothetical protein